MKEKTEMNIEVLKFGGGIFTDQWVMPLIRETIVHKLDCGLKIIAVVSAIGKTTRGQLAKIPKDLVPDPDPREKDLLMASGENDAIALLAMYLRGKEMKAKSFTGQQAGIITDDNFGDANIIDVKTGILRNFFKENDVAVVAGFQGVTKDGDITTLGFDGSDTTAITMAYRFGAKRCTLYKGVDGIYTHDPKVESNDAALLYKYLHYDDAYEAALKGTAKGIVHEKALKLCRDEYEKGKKVPEIVVHNISPVQSMYTTICGKRTEFYRGC